MTVLGKDIHPLMMPIILSQIVTLESCFQIPGSKALSVVNYFLMTLSVYYFIKYITKNHLPFSLVQKIFVLWIFVLFAMAIPDIVDPYRDYVHLKMFLSSILFLYTLPLLMTAEIDGKFIRQLFKFVFFLSILYIPSLLVVEEEKSHEWATVLAEGSLILLMTYPYHSSRKRFTIIGVILLTIVLMMLEARRNKVVYYGGGLVFALMINIFSNSNYSIGRKVILVLLCLSFGVGLYFSSAAFENFFYRVGTGFDSREDIIDLFVADFNKTPNDWIWGRGLYGQFEGGALSTYEDTGLRDGIENGYLYLVLKGGWIWLALLIIISIISIFKGLFKSNNLLCKGFAMIILLYYFDMIGFGIPQTTMKYIMIFVSIAGCNSEWLRQCSDRELAEEIGLK